MCTAKPWFRQLHPTESHFVCYLLHVGTGTKESRPENCNPGCPVLPGALYGTFVMKCEAFRKIYPRHSGHPDRTSWAEAAAIICSSSWASERFCTPHRERPWELGNSANMRQALLTLRPYMFGTCVKNCWKLMSTVHRKIPKVHPTFVHTSWPRRPQIAGEVWRMRRLYAFLLLHGLGGPRSSQWIRDACSCLHFKITSAGLLESKGR